MRRRRGVQPGVDGVQRPQQPPDGAASPARRGILSLQPPQVRTAELGDRASLAAAQRDRRVEPRASSGQVHAIAAPDGRQRRRGGHRETAVAVRGRRASRPATRGCAPSREPACPPGPARTDGCTAASNRCAGDRRTWRSRGAPSPSGPGRSNTDAGWCASRTAAPRPPTRSGAPPSTTSTSVSGCAWLRRDSDKNSGPRARLRPARCAQIARQQHPGRRRVRHHPLPAVLRRLRPHPQRPVRRVEVVGPQRAQLLPPQRGVVGQREHHPVTDRLVAERPSSISSHCCSVGIHGNFVSRGTRPRCTPAEPPAGRVAAAADRVGLPHALLDQVVVEQPHRHQPLLQRRVRQPRPESIDTTFAPRRLGRDVNSRTNTATCARVAVTGSTPSRSHTSQVLGQPRAYASIVRGARPRSLHTCSHSPPARAGPAPATSRSAPPCRHTVSSVRGHTEDP